MRNHKKSDIIISFAIPLLVICIFAATVLGVSVLGASVFKTMQADTEASTQCTIAAGYMRTKLLNAENTGAVSVITVDGIEVLCIDTTLGEAVYQTRIFLQNGVLKESFVQKDTPFSFAAAHDIAKIQQCEISLNQSGLCIIEIKSTQNDFMRVAVQLTPEV